MHATNAIAMKLDSGMHNTQRSTQELQSPYITSHATSKNGEANVSSAVKLKGCQVASHAPRLAQQFDLRMGRTSPHTGVKQSSGQVLFAPAVAQGEDNHIVTNMLPENFLFWHLLTWWHLSASSVELQQVRRFDKYLHTLWEQQK